jgi:hypothetical protein
MTNDKYQMTNKVLIMLLIVILTFASGCAKTVTPEFESGKQLSIYATFRGNIDTIQNKYYILFRNDASPQVPFAPNQFIEPGEKPLEDTIDYYATYLPTWKNFIVLDGNTFYFVQPPYTSEAYPTKEVLAVWSGADTNQMTISFPLSKLAPNTNRLYFDIVTVDKTTKMVNDNLSPLNNSPSSYYVFTIKDSIVSGKDETSIVSRESLDIIDWGVSIQ